MSMPHAVEAEAAARRHNRIFAAVCGTMLAGTSLVNLAADPFRVFHDAWTRPFARPERHLMPGLIRNSRAAYDAITVGTSHCGNFRPEVIDPELGWKTLRCTLDGSTVPEQMMVIRTALDAGRVRHVLWGIDHFATLDPPDRAASSGKIPVHLYERSWRTPLQYLVSSDTLGDSLSVLRGKGERDVARRGAWFEEQVHRFGPGKAFDAYPAWLEYVLSVDRKPVPTIQDGNVARIAGVIRDNPSVEFVCLLPPVSVLSVLPEFRNGLFEERVRFRKDLAEALVDLPNCRLFDFETSDEVTHNFDLYKDPTHYNQEINDWMVREIAADRHRIRRGDIGRANREFERQNREFVARLLRPDHPDHDRLKMATLALDPATVRRPMVAAEDGPTRR